MLRPTREQATRELLAAIEAAEASGRLPAPSAVGLGHFWSAAEIAEWKDFRSGGPLPVTAGALELLGIDVELEHTV